MVLFFLSTLLFSQIITDQVEQNSAAVQDFSIFEPVDRNEYILGAGDVLQMVVEGGTSEVMLISGLPALSVCQVSGDGMIQLPGIGQLNVLGLSIADAETDLQRLVALYYPGTSVGLGLLQPRSLKVWINGMVEQPGQYTLYSINRVSDLVTEAGGLSSYSSRTGWMITSSGDSILVNLQFDRTSGGPFADPFVQGGSVVCFNLVTDPVYVIRPGIRNYTDSYSVPEMETWDYIPGESVENLIYRIGGITGNVDLARSTIRSNSVSTPIWTRGTGFSDAPVSAGDTLRLVVQGNDVYVAGAVHQRGIIAYIPGAPASAYIDRAGGLLYNSSIGGTTITRDGSPIASGDQALETEVLPGDVIEVPYGWVAKNAQAIGILATIVGVTSTIIYLTR